MWRQRVAFAIAIILALATVGSPVAAASFDASKIDPALLARVLADPGAGHDVIVRSKPGSSDRVARAAAALARAGGTPRYALGIVGGVSGRISGRLLLALTNSPSVDFVFADAVLRAAEGTSDPVGSPGIVSTGATSAWRDYGVTGRGIGVAVLDSGVNAHADLAGRIAAAVDLTETPVAPGTDPGGHGTHVAGLVAGNGASSGGTYTGVAPGASILDVRVIRSDGTSNVGIVLRGMQWVLANRTAYGIKVANLSLGAPVERSYKLDPLGTAAEVLTFAGITVVVSAGNSGPTGGTITSPANDPYVISVGALDDAQTLTTADDTVATFSSRGHTAIDGISKPDLAAPGRHMVSLRSPGSTLDNLYPERRVSGTDGTASYFTLSGTSMAAPVVAGAVALILERNGSLTPAQVKKRLRATATPLAGYGVLEQGAGRIDVAKALASIDPSPERASGRVTDSFAKDMRRFVEGQPIQWKDLTFNGGVDSHNITWENITWENITWENITWENITWESFTWQNITWENITWENITWESTDQLTYLPLAGMGAWWSEAR